MGVGLVCVLKQRERKGLNQHLFKEERYKAIILLTRSLLDFEKEKGNLLKHGRNFKNTEELIDELKTEKDNMILFASDAALRAIIDFINAPTEERYYILAIAMRKDLYSLKTKIRPSELQTTKTITILENNVNLSR